MKAWVYDSERDRTARHHLYLEERPIPEPGPEDLLLKVLKVSICGTDEALFSGNLSRAVQGVIPGHEFCGAIVKAGPKAGEFPIGQVVAGESHYRFSADEEEGVIGLWPPKRKGGTWGRLVHGAYAEYICIPKACAHPVPEHLVNGHFWPSLFEPAGNDFLLARLIEKSGAARVGVFGCGPHGLYAQIFLKHFRCDQILAFETDSFRVQFARRLGCADAVLNSQQQDLQKEVGRLTEGEGLDASVDMVGKSGSALEQCFQLTRDGGTVFLFGLFSKDFEIQGRPANDLIFGRRELDFTIGQKKLRLVGVTGREGIWADLIRTVSESCDLQSRLMEPVEVVGPLNLLGDELQRNRTDVMKRAFTAFER